MSRRRDFSKYVGLASGQADQQQVYEDLYRRGKDSNNRLYPKPPPVKQINIGKIKQLKLPGFKAGGPVDDPLKGIAKMIGNIQAGKTGIKTIDKQKKKDAILTKKLKKMAKTSKVKSAKSGLNITKPEIFGIERNIIMPKLAKDGGKVQKLEGGGKVKKYIGGGPVKSEKGKSTCRGMGAAMTGGKFKIR